MSSCIICEEECPPLTRVTRWGSIRKYCSNKCVKTAYRNNHPEKDYDSKRKYAENNKEKRVEQTERYRKKNPGYYTQYASLYSRKKQQAQIKSLTEVDLVFLKEYYNQAHNLGLEVDHIIPLTHEKVSGLHVPWNLQMLTRSQNAAKSNKLDEDVIAILRKKD